jgi:hypothetical protein
VHVIRGLLLAGGYASLLLEEHAGPLTKEQRDYLDIIVANTRRIKDVLASLSRVAESAELQLTRLSLRDLVQEVMQVWCLEDGGGWQWEGDAQCDHYIPADRQKLRDALLDLLRDYEWSGDIGVGIQAETCCINVTLRGVFAPRPGTMAAEVQASNRMGWVDGKAKTEMFPCPDAVRLHGGSALLRRGEGGARVITIQLPALISSSGMGGQADA